MNAMNEIMNHCRDGQTAACKLHAALWTFACGSL